MTREELLTAYEDLYRAVKRLQLRLEAEGRHEDVAAALRQLLVDFAPSRIGVR